jgi:NAD(P)H dehydrogenase (quinone)
MGNIIAVLAHPDENSFSAALFASYLEGVGDSGRAINLYQEEFDPRMDLSELRRHIPIDQTSMEYARALQHSSSLALFFPDWWGAEPAMMKGWLDRILRQDIAYARGGFGAPGNQRSSGTRGLLSGCSLRVYVTSDSSGDQVRDLEQIYRHRFVETIGGFCGFATADLQLFSPVRGSKLSIRRGWLEMAKQAGSRDARSAQ